MHLAIRLIKDHEHIKKPEIKHNQIDLSVETLPTDKNDNLPLDGFEEEFEVKSLLTKSAFALRKVRGTHLSNYATNLTLY